MGKRIIALLLGLSLLFTGCGSKGKDTGTNMNNKANAAADTGSTSEEETVSTDVSETGTMNISDMFTERDYKVDYKEEESAVIKLENTTAVCDSDDVQVEESTVTITEEGTYILSGTLDDGMIIINAEKTDKIQLVLDNVDIHSETSAAVYVLQADKVFVTMAPDSKNTLSNGGKFTAIDDNNIDAAIFSKEDLTLNGNGSLTVDSPAGHGIVSKDDLVITSGSYNITADGHGLSGKDSVRIADGSFSVTAGKDGVHADNTEDTSSGFLYTAGGTYQITAKEKGMKASGNLTINGGTFSIDSADDAVHSNMSLTVNGGTFEISTGDDGFHADSLLTITAGEINISQSYEGIEGLQIEISGGNITLTASDDGLNAAGGNDNSGTEGFRGKDAFDTNSDCYINISGGVLKIDASGDGIDSNGYINISGGETYVSGPTDSGNGALDYGLEASATGGILIAAGASGMAETFGDTSTQGAIFVSFDKQSAGSKVELADSSGTTILSWEAGKEFESVVITCPEIVQGETYTLTAGSYSTQITMEDIVYGSGSGMGQPGGNPGTGQPGGGFEKGQQGNAPEMGNPPEAPGTDQSGDGSRAGRPGNVPEMGNPPEVPGADQSGGNSGTGLPESGQETGQIGTI